MTATKDALPGTVLADMVIDLYASKKEKRAWFLHDRDFEPALTELTFNPETSRLTFIYEDGTSKDLGSVIVPSVKPYLMRANEITFLQVSLGPDGKMTDVNDAMIVPLRLIENSSKNLPVFTVC